jgi:hypothetical protein
MKNHLFECYSTPLYHWLLNKGLQPKFVTRHNTTGKPFAAFKRTDALDAALTQWAANRQQ